MKIKPNKTASLVFTFMFFFQGINSQDYLITFSGSGQSNTVESVEVKNIDQQETLILSGTDTLHLLHNVGVGHLNSVHENMIIYPNPTDHECRLELHQTGPGKVNIEIFDINGRLSMSNSIQLTAGMHAFTISGLKAGIYMVKVNTPKHIYSQRLVSASGFNLVPDVQYDGIVQGLQAGHELKSTSNMVAMQYNEGERLVFKAISGDYAHTKSLVPIKSQDIDFEFIDCIDGDGNHYGVVSIGEQIWMAENLKSTHYSIGTPIEYPGNDNYAWHNNTSGAYAWYNNDEANYKDTYGALYNWHAVNNNDGLCPTGWHVPQQHEWYQMKDFVELKGYSNSDISDGAGNAMKSCRQVDSPFGGNCATSEHPFWWFDETHHGFDAFGFSGVPGGFRYSDGSLNFVGMGQGAIWWSATESASSSAWRHRLHYQKGDFQPASMNKRYGYSVRCLRD